MPDLHTPTKKKKKGQNCIYSTKNTLYLVNETKIRQSTCVMNWQQTPCAAAAMQPKDLPMNLQVQLPLGS